MSETKLYRRRFIPDECILLKDDQILMENEEVIITRWKTIRPKKELDHGLSCYYLKKNLKVNKFYRRDNTLMYWYCDIVRHEYDKKTSCYIFTDLLADVVVYPDGQIFVYDLCELADAQDQGLITVDDMKLALRTTDKLLKLIYSGEFSSLQKYIHTAEENQPCQ